MTENHPITPTPELMNEWRQQCSHFAAEFLKEDHIATQAANWGADQELEACCEFLDDNELCDPNFHKDLRAARRPKLPSLKEQALHILYTHGNLTRAEADTVRRALEQLPND